jgi:hypothetical protein
MENVIVTVLNNQKHRKKRQEHKDVFCFCLFVVFEVKPCHGKTISTTTTTEIA